MIHAAGPGRCELVMPETIPVIKHDGVLTIATGRSRKETEWKNREMLWSELAERLSRTVRTSET